MTEGKRVSSPAVDTSALPSDEPMTADDLLILIVGAHPQAERLHRPLAYRLREQALRWLDQQPAGELDAARRPLVLTDLWYVNAPDLAAAPAISIGEAGLNAATAYLSSRLPTAFVIDGAFRVQADLEFIDRRVCIWGASASTTASGIDLFIERYFDDFMRAAHDMPLSHP